MSDFRPRERGKISRFKARHQGDASEYLSLADDHPAIVGQRTLFPKTVVNAVDSPRLLVSGKNNPKLGDHITKGPRAGWPIYHLTLEERATCSSSCAQWTNCLVPGSRVLTADLRWVAIETLSEGDSIAAFDEFANGHQHRMTKVATVEKVGRAVQPSYRITTDRGVVTASAKHLWLRRRSRSSYKWLETDRLTIGDKLQFFAEPWEEDRSYDAARLRGFVEGEGYVTVHGNNGFAKVRTGWSQRPTKLCDEIIQVANGLGFKTSRYERIAGVAQTAISHIDVLGGWREVARFLGRIRPTRLIERSEEIWLNHDIGGRGGGFATVLAIEPVGEIEVVTIQTSTKTLIAEGFCTHNCYGNSMHMARRHRIDEHFYALLSAELTILAREHRAGFLVRLHTLGDFPSVEYVKFWADMLEKIPQLHVFGFTARNENDPDPETRRIAQAIAFVANQVWDSFSIRFSTPTAVPQGATVYEKAVKSPEVIMCPAQIQATTACATCGLCWADATRFKTIGFLRHGMKKPTGKRGPRAPKESGDAQPVGRPPMDTEELAAATRKVLAVLRRAADPDGISTISITDISRESGHTPTRVRHCLDLLLSDKVISAEHRGHGAFPSTYELDLKAADQALTTATPRQDPERQMPDWLAASRARLAQFDSSLK